MAPEGLLRQFSQFPKSKINNIIIIITRYNRVYVIQISPVYYKLSPHVKKTSNLG